MGALVKIRSGCRWYKAGGIQGKIKRGKRKETTHGYKRRVTKEA